MRMTLEAFHVPYDREPIQIQLRTAPTERCVRMGSRALTQDLLDCVQCTVDEREQIHPN